MPAMTPDFDRIAEQLLSRDGHVWTTVVQRRDIAAQLRLVWNARGAADVAKIEAVFERPEAYLGSVAQRLGGALRTLDR